MIPWHLLRVAGCEAYLSVKSVSGKVIEVASHLMVARPRYPLCGRGPRNL